MSFIGKRGFSFLFPQTTLLKKQGGIIFLIILLFTGGGYFAFKGLKIEVKAQVAQVLLDYAWEKTLETGKEQRPWSSFDGSPIFRLTIPKYKVNQIVLKGTSGQSLAFGPAFHEESSLLGEKGATIISSHRDSHGIYIKNIKLGDIINMQDRYKKWHTYTVEDLFIIDVNKENIVLNHYDDRLLIVTCYPFDAILSGTTLRYIVSALKFTT